MKKGLKLNGIVVLFLLLVFVALLTYIIPAGEYNRIEVGGRTLVDGSSFKYLESRPITIFEFFKSIPKGLQAATSLTIMISLIGGSIRLIESTSSIRNFIFKIKDKIGEERSYLILIIISLFFGLLGTFPGMLEAVIPFAPLCIGISLALGYDSIVGISISLVPIVIGWASGVTNPWTTGIGQSIAELPMFSGISYRFVCFLVFFAFTILYTLFYANNVIKNSEKSIIKMRNKENFINIEESVEYTFKNTLVLITFTATILIIVYGALYLRFDMIAMSAVYIIGAIIAGILYGYSPNKISEELISGGKDMFIAAFAIGMARGISVIMTDARIIDTVVHYVVSILQGKSAYFNALSMFLIQTVINFFIPSGSGQAVITLPILIPVADLIGLNRQITILAFQFGDGLSNLIYPTVGALIAVLSYSKITFLEWFKYIWKYAVGIMLVASILIVVAVAINFS